MTDEHHVVLDDSAMLAAGRGSVAASRLIDNAHNRKGWFLYAPTCAMVEADRVRSGIAEHFASMPAVRILPLDLSAALSIARQTTWASAHVQHVAGPTLEHPEGVAVATADPARWKGEPIRVIDLTA
ncbi:hypothetical protein I6A60_34290 [Frankia sp. AgB1.9]|uniref:hypothetical protein n=1 Tax=unclassified Frankia TaxID=2632575 RepID=UPI001933180B|nr:MULTISPECIES: hypothetical protein [unclassified Frankia]MBL7486617.1 hypothetical protein [Frankia sp. AgW1.1]MBL7552885.1 hypothetical protein [Frankia sp. AgB1.9]MBL7621088.1 hypothetical protein [Frankia sp. AgB1.8]